MAGELKRLDHMSCITGSESLRDDLRVALQLLEDADKFMASQEETATVWAWRNRYARAKGE